jgi:hypothetical protein
MMSRNGDNQNVLKQAQAERGVRPVSAEGGPGTEKWGSGPVHPGAERRRSGYNE